MRGGDGAGIKILNPSPPRPGVQGQNIVPWKTRTGRGGAGRGKIAIPTLYLSQASLPNIRWGMICLYNISIALGKFIVYVIKGTTTNKVQPILLPL